MPHKRSQTLRNVTTHPGCGVRGLLLSIVSQYVEKINVATCRTSSTSASSSQTT
jgi:hypothetical protein